jgi:hypothetical protein
MRPGAEGAYDRVREPREKKLGVKMLRINGALKRTINFLRLVAVFYVLQEDQRCSRELEV